ncbi:hypothetical protein BHE74_00003427 [Ensete ventricosum]|nr:hypothetical protein BHE74_00003427 [Ensete ventricosum]
MTKVPHRGGNPGRRGPRDTSLRTLRPCSSELAKGTAMTPNEPKEDIRPDQGDKGSTRRTEEAKTKAKEVQERE